MKYVIVGTAGHVDHGKTTLIQQLTGVDTDRLREEKQRGISIELGFAPFRLPSGRLAGVVDVPGHEKFIKHMLAGAGGMDLVLLVVAANEGVMPQTLEHLHILNLLEVEKGIIVVTKKDLVDPDWLLLVEEEIRESVADTFLADAPFVFVSALQSEGLDELKQTIDSMTEQVQGKNAATAFRLPVDRVFTMKGSGTVVTGTLVTGRMMAGGLAELLPSRKEARIRQLQVHGQKVDEAVAGQRVAVNLAGVEVEELERGNVIAEPGHLYPTKALDIRLKLLSRPFGKEIRKPLQNRARVRFHTGTQEILGRILLLDADTMEPGSEGYAQIFLEEEAVVARGDHYIIRSYSPVTTIGGGTVIEPYAKKHKRFQEEVIAEMMVKEQGTPAELIEQRLLQDPDRLFLREELAKETGLHDQGVAQALEQLLEARKVQKFQVDQRELVIHCQVLQQYAQWIRDHLERFHQQQPLKTGMPAEELRARLFKTMTSRVFAVLLQYFLDENILSYKEQRVSLPGFTIQLSSEQERIRQALRTAWQENRFSPPTPQDVAKEINVSVVEAEKVAEAMLESGEAIRTQPGDIIFAVEAWNDAVQFVRAHLSTHEGLTLAEFRDGLQTSRKYALGLLELMDEKRITRRLGDQRVLGK
jgi:selenocysteine-specific elongation factor